MRPRAPQPDIPALLGLTGLGAMSVVGIYWFANITLAIMSGGAITRSPLGGAALLLVMLTAVLLVLPGRYPLSGLRVAATIVTIGFSTLAIELQLSPAGWPGYATWQFGADTFLCFGLALRGRPIWAWIGMGLMVALTVCWSTVFIGSPWQGFDDVYRQAATLVIGTLLAAALRSTASRIVEFRAAEARLVEEEHRRAAIAEQREAELEAVQRIVLPALERLARGETSEADRAEHRILEAELRDRIRGRRLASGVVLEAVRAARRGGSDVVLMDDLGQQSDSERGLGIARQWLADQLEQASGAPEMTARLSRDERGSMVTFTTSRSTSAAVFRITGSSSAGAGLPAASVSSPVA